jgi:hypothetical protein
MFQITGAAAAIRWVYDEAARVGTYVITRDKETKRWTVQGTIVAADAFKLTQRPLVLVVRHEAGEWRWPITSAVSTTEGPFAADLGEREK